MKKRFLMYLAAACILGAQLPAHAATHAAAPVTESAEMSEGEIRKVDKDARKVTIRHGDLKNLSMPPMTMVFEVTEPAMLDKVKAGDKISFVAEKVEGRYTVTRIEVRN
ncbi:copper-binding protein [Noviherbaspirillum sp.]|uniref:copper-binding protein n=1 Tax=Noviherbaspirillum sp. TaxID=1926288 RepID=UPI002FE2C925